VTTGPWRLGQETFGGKGGTHRRLRVRGRGRLSRSSRESAALRPPACFAAAVAPVVFEVVLQSVPSTW